MENRERGTVLDRRPFFTVAAAAAVLPKEDAVDYWIRRIKETGYGPSDFRVPEELLDEIRRRSGIFILVN